MESKIQNPKSEIVASAMDRHARPPSAEVLDARKAQRVELILQQLESLPTLSPLALRVLEVTSDDTASGKDAVQLICADPALSAKVLKLVRCSEGGRALNVTTVDRAVLLLGFDALRSAVLSVQVFEL